MVEKFTDSTGQEWSVALNMGTLVKLKEDGLDFLDVSTDESEGQSSTYVRLQTNMSDLASCLEILTEDQRGDLGMDLATFLPRLDGHTLGVGKEAVYKEWLNFSLDSGSPMLIAMLEKWMKDWPAMVEQVRAKVDGLPLKEFIQKALDEAGEAFQKTSGK